MPQSPCLNEILASPLVTGEGLGLDLPKPEVFQENKKIQLVESVDAGKKLFTEFKQSASKMSVLDFSESEIATTPLDALTDLKSKNFPFDKEAEKFTAAGFMRVLKEQREEKTWVKPIALSPAISKASCMTAGSGMAAIKAPSVAGFAVKNRDLAKAEELKKDAVKRWIQAQFSAMKLLPTRREVIDAVVEMEEKLDGLL
ncbi:unnamed protein product [Amoebophrya sp. A120]|nr:unnamed protein product [Amoebophrya sp. A120]|eukprot:GSA120T00013180001.1